MAITVPQQLNEADRMTVLPSMTSRVKASVVKFALYIIGEPIETPNHVNRLSWAKSAIAHPDDWTQTLLPYLLNNNSFLNGGSSITDDELSGHIETAIVNNYITP